MSSDTVQDYLVKPATCAAVAAAGASYMYPGAFIPMWSYDVPVSALAFGTVYAGSCISALFHDKVFPHIPKVGGIINAPATEAMAVASIAGTELAVLSVTNPQAIGDLGLTSIVAQAAGARVLGSYIADTWLKPWVESALE
jgi:hypothetical protein